MSLSAFIALLVLQAAPPEPGDMLDRTIPYVHPEAGFALTLPAGWRYFPLEDASGVALLSTSYDARIEAFAVAVDASGVPGLPDDTLDALMLRLDGPGFRRGMRVRVPLVVAGENTPDRPQVGDVEALSYTGGDGSRRWTGIAATRCGADILLTLDVATADYEGARATFGSIIESWALVLTGGTAFPCGGG